MYSNKYIIVGEMGVGKTSISHRYINDTFERQTPSTIGVDFFTKILSPSQKINIWDTSGACRFNSVIPAFFRSSKAAIIVYDCNQPSTLEQIPKWIEQTKKHNSTTRIVIVGNKCESINTPSEPEMHGFPHFRCSAKTGEGVIEIFNFINKELKLSEEIKESIFVNSEEHPDQPCTC